jgi:hypothetical protein
MPTSDQDFTIAKHCVPIQDSSSRRDFLKKLGALPIAAAAAGHVHSASSAQTRQTTLPLIKFGKYSLPRLICGANPINGGSHLSVFVNHQMKQIVGIYDHYSDQPAENAEYTSRFNSLSSSS